MDAILEIRGYFEGTVSREEVGKVFWGDSWYIAEKSVGISWTMERIVGRRQKESL